MSVQFPPGFIKSLESIESFHEEAFVKVHESVKQVTSIRLNPLKDFHIEDLNYQPALPAGRLQTTELPLPKPGYKFKRVPWAQSGYYLPERPSFTFDPLFHAGCYYVQEASSMFLEQALKQLLDLSRPLKILDLSAAPGGKSTHIQSLVSKDALLVSNEVIRSRANILKDNLVKWGSGNVIVTNNDPADFSAFENYFDVIVVDAPCSGSGLFRRDPKAMEEWSPNNVMHCSQRQQRILADIFPALKEGGLLVYSTCSYSAEEDEQIAGWLMQSFPVRIRPLTIEPGWGIVDTGNGYRFWPDKLEGEGFYLACFQKESGAGEIGIKARKMLEPVNKKEAAVIGHWIDSRGLELLKFEDTVYAWPEKISADFNFILNKLRVVYSGTLVGEIIRDKFIPSHALALSEHLSEKTAKVELDRENAISYLQRKTPVLDISQKGWQVVTYNNFALGWINAVQGRINNYYPKELRIIKDN